MNIMLINQYPDFYIYFFIAKTNINNNKQENLEMI